MPEREETEMVLSEYPRPLMSRQGWICLNGWWDYAILEGANTSEEITSYAAPMLYDGRVLVPFSPETELSGVGRSLRPEDLIWYRRTIEVPALNHERLLINFEAVDWECACYFNGTLVGVHAGGYDAFSLDVTDTLLDGSCEAVLELCVRDPTEKGGQPRGKQRLREGHIWYPGQSGIWQTVWSEIVPDAYVVSLTALGNPDNGVVTLEIEVNLPGESLAASLFDGAKCVGHTSGVVLDRCSVLTMDAHHVSPWSPESPILYELELFYGVDRVSSYVAFRTVSVEPDSEGVPRLCLNHHPFMLKAVLDQGYWPNGLMTAPTDDNLVADIEAAHNLGFNAIRMHQKVERQRFYTHCDRMGMLVIQDCVSGGRCTKMRVAMKLPTKYPWTRRSINDRSFLIQWLLGSRAPEVRESWTRESMALIKRLRGFPCIVVWSLFNEGWGQFESGRMVEMVHSLDQSRPIDAASGWFDRGVGDFESVHDYSEELRELRARLGNRASKKRSKARRAVMLSEFGGVTLPVKDHRRYEEAWGYHSFGDRDEFVAYVHRIIAEAESLWERGLAGFVYTQLYDVERECNGLLTYDREVDKMGRA